MTHQFIQDLRRTSVPLHVEVADLFRNRILSGELACGAQLPTVCKLSAQMGLAKMTVHKSMDTLDAEGLIDRHSGRGTFVRDVLLRKPKILEMQADLSQLHTMMDDLETTIATRDPQLGDTKPVDENMHAMRRIHLRKDKPFSMVDLELRREIYNLAPKRFETEIVVLVLNDLGIDVAAAKQRMTISHADVEAAQTLNIPLNSPVMRVTRQFFDSKEQCVYHADLIYPGDSLGFEIEFKMSN